MIRIPARLAAILVASATTALAEPSVHEVSQHGKAFHPDTLTIAAGDRVVLHNDDKRVHNIRVFHPKLDFNSGKQEPAEDVTITFDQPGTYYVTCGIHTQMELKVEVTAEGNP